MDYYPFGEEITGRSIYYGTQAKYKFTGKERDTETSYDYFGARYYDSRIARWLQVDPLAEKYPGWSTYNYTKNNPLRIIDPNGSELSDWYDADGNFVTHIDDNKDVIVKTNKNKEEVEDLYASDRDAYNSERDNSIAKGDDSNFWIGVVSYELNNLSTELPEAKNIESPQISEKIKTMQIAMTGYNRLYNFIRTSDRFPLNINPSVGGASIAWGTRYNIINELVHEIGHAVVFLSSDTFDRYDGSINEEFSGDFQQKHWSWGKTTEDYRKATLNYLKK
jgi:RHS repeat-associated protein